MNDMIDIKVLIDWLGVEGAKEGIKKSKRLTVLELKKVADFYNVDYSSRINRNDLISRLILKFDKRITMDIVNMAEMRAADLSEYLSNTGCSKEEIMELLDKNEIPYKKSDSKASLIRHAADQITSFGIFKRISY